MSAPSAEPSRTARETESRAVLDRVARESESVGRSLAQRASDHFAGRDADAEGLADDPMEVWGRRIGRAVSILVALGLMWWLGLQLGWW